MWQPKKRQAEAVSAGFHTVLTMHTEQCHHGDMIRRLGRKISTLKADAM